MCAKIKILITILALSFSLGLQADDLRSADSTFIKAAGIPLHPAVIFANGSRETGFRFATNLSVSAAQAWYREQLPNWTLYNEYSNWMLYQHPPDSGSASVLSMNHISIQKNDKLPQWFSLDKTMTTEITITVMK